MMTRYRNAYRVNISMTNEVLAQQQRFDELLNQSVKDSQTVTPQGAKVKRLADGVNFRPSPTHIDERGSVIEMFDPRWNWHPDPLVFAYSFTIRPNIVKGWNLHLEHEDRYVLLSGEMRVVFYDLRPGSPTYGEVSEIVLSEKRRGIVNVPKGLWHADHNIGSTDAVIVNFPTIMYDHANPDKYRLPIDTPLIPYSFGDATGG